MIPRSPISELINNKFKIIKKIKPKNILDLCTGSGCIAILCSYIFPKSKIDATDISSKALYVAKKNITLHKVKNINLIKSNLFNKIKKKYDLIITNPPYINRKDIKYLPKEYKYEPYISLVSSKNGTFLIKQIIKQSKKFLSDNGYLICETGHQKNNIIQKFPNLKFKWIKLKNGTKGIFIINKKKLN